MQPTDSQPEAPPLSDAPLPMLSRAQRDILEKSFSPPAFDLTRITDETDKTDKKILDLARALNNRQKYEEDEEDGVRWWSIWTPNHMGEPNIFWSYRRDQNAWSHTTDTGKKLVISPSEGVLRGYQRDPSTELWTETNLDDDTFGSYLQDLRNKPLPSLPTDQLSFVEDQSQIDNDDTAPTSSYYPN
jgi:hypothetical protein